MEFILRDCTKTHAIYTAPVQGAVVRLIVCYRDDAICGCSITVGPEAMIQDHGIKRFSEPPLRSPTCGEVAEALAYIDCLKEGPIKVSIHRYIVLIPITKE